MNEDVFNTSLRGFLKKVGITSQREIEKAVREAVAAGRAIVLPVKLGSKGYTVEELYTPIPYIIPAQLFAAHLASQKGLNPDRDVALIQIGGDPERIAALKQGTLGAIDRSTCAGSRPAE